MSDMSAMIKIIENNPMLLTEIGDCPNIEFPTNGGKVFWKVLNEKNGWQLQCNYITGLSRILDENNIRKAWGSPVIMKEKFKRLTRQEFLEPGDVIGISRGKPLGLYEHYAVYLGNHKVIHYAGDNEDFNGKVAVRPASLDTFLKGDKNYFILHFDKDSLNPHKIYAGTNFNMGDVSYNCGINLKKSKDFKLYFPEETVRRALSRVGEEKYNLLLNNCEHFAIWCKTGVSESYQVKRVIGTFVF